MSDIKGPGDTRERTKQWLEAIFQSYHLALKGNKTASKENKNGGQAIDVIVNDFDIGPGYCPMGDGREPTLSDLLSISLSYTVGAKSTEEKTENIIVKIPPNDKTDREMAQKAEVDRREILFYTEALPQLEEWAKSRNFNIKIAVPLCFFAKYQKSGVSEGTGDGCNSVIDAESVLVLEDMRVTGYSMRDFKTGLSLSEATAALGKIAVVHALSWAMQEATGLPLGQLWEFVYKPDNAAEAYQTMVEEGFPTLSNYLEKEESGREILRKLRILHPNAAELLYELLKAPSAPTPSCLTHMDFWCNNLLFRRAHNSNESSSESGVECLILDWQMIAISRPTHDVALLLFTSLTPEIRKEHTDNLLKHYWKVFQTTVSQVGVELTFDFAVIQEEFKKSQLLALLLVIGSIDMALGTKDTQARLMQVLRDMSDADLI